MKIATIVFRKTHIDSETGQMLGYVKLNAPIVLADDQALTQKHIDDEMNKLSGNTSVWQLDNVIGPLPRY